MTGNVLSLYPCYLSKYSKFARFFITFTDSVELNLAVHALTTAERNKITLSDIKLTIHFIIIIWVIREKSVCVRVFPRESSHSLPLSFSFAISCGTFVSKLP